MGVKNPVDLKKAFTSSLFKCFLFENGKLIGVGKVLADGTDCSYICDVAVLPDHQRRGFGKCIVSKLLELPKGHKK